MTLNEYKVWLEQKGLKFELKEFEGKTDLMAYDGKGKECAYRIQDSEKSVNEHMRTVSAVFFPD